MKFSRSIQFNAVPDWSSHYIAYSNLKKLIYTLEKSVHQTDGGRPDNTEAALLLGTSGEDLDEAFLRSLDAELQKVCSFYEAKEREVFEEVTSVLEDLQSHKDGKDLNPSALESWGLGGGQSRPQSNASARPRSGSAFRAGFGRPRRSSTLSAPLNVREDEQTDDTFDVTNILTRSRTSFDQRYQRDTGYVDSSVEDLRNSREFPGTTAKRRPSLGPEDFSEHSFTPHFASSVALKKRAISTYVSLCELKSFIQLNRTGFSKALKKFDKILDRDLRDRYMEKSVDAAYPFKKDTMQRLQNTIDKVERAYADVAAKGDLQQARRELRTHLREYVIWERNTVWREMIGIERKAQAARLGLRPTLLSGPYDHSRVQRQGDEAGEEGGKEFATPLGRVSCPNWVFSPNTFLLLAIIATFFILLFVPILKKPEQHNCFAMLVFVSLLWATEVIPLFVTSLLVPFLVVVLRIACSDDEPRRRLDAKAATVYIFSAMWTPVIMLLLGGFTIAAALSKYQIARILSTVVLSKAGTRPRTVLLTNMLVTMVSSMWISNVAAPVLSYSIVQPILRNLPADSPFCKSLVLGIALAACIGGMASPIASPQNIIALEHMHPEPSWLVWFFIALPVCLLSVLLVWALLLLTFPLPPGTGLVPLKPVRERITGVHWFVAGVSAGTILLWCVTHQIDGLVGDMGVVAIIPLVLFFGSGVLTKEDFNNFLWTIVILAAGGLALGKAVTSSGLLHTVALAISQRVAGLGLYAVFVTCSALILVVASFISHTVAALIVLPLVQQVGANMDTPHPNLLVMGSALMCSAAMALPTSGFPNMTAIMMEDSHTGQRYLKVTHFISRGVPSSILTFVVVISFGYGLMRAVGF